MMKRIIFFLRIRGRERERERERKKEKEKVVWWPVEENERKASP